MSCMISAIDNRQGIRYINLGYTMRGENQMSKVTAKYQITIPPEVREQLGILPGTKWISANRASNTFWWSTP